MAQAVKRALLLLAALANTAALAQETIDDPTRPPAALTAPRDRASVAVAGEPVLQSILVSQRAGGRRVAVIDGKTLRQGERLGNALVETIGPTEVVLLRGSKRVTLKLYRPLARMAAQP